MMKLLQILGLICIMACLIGYVVLLNIFILNNNKKSSKKGSKKLGGAFDFVLDPIEDAASAAGVAITDTTMTLIEWVEAISKKAYDETVAAIMNIVYEGLDEIVDFTDDIVRDLDIIAEPIRQAFLNSMKFNQNKTIPLIVGMIGGFTWDMFLPQGSKEEKCNRVNQICNNYDEIKSTEGAQFDIEKCEDVADQIRTKQWKLCAAANADPFGLADPIGIAPMIWSAAWDPVRKSEANMLLAGLMDTVFKAGGAENPPQLLNLTDNFLHSGIDLGKRGDPDGILSVASYGNWLRSTENIETDKEKYINELAELCSRPVSLEFKNLILCRVIMNLGINLAPDIIKDKNVVLDKETLESLPGYVIKEIGDEFERFYSNDITENFKYFGKLDYEQLEYCSVVWKLYAKQGLSLGEISSELEIPESEVRNQIATYIQYKKEYKQLSNDTGVLNDATFVAQNVFKNRFNTIHSQWKDYIYMFILNENKDTERSYLDSTPVGKLRMLNELRSAEENRLLDKHPFIKNLLTGANENMKIYVTYKMMLTEWTRKYVQEFLTVTQDLELRKGEPIKKKEFVSEDEVNLNNFLENSVWTNNMWNMANVNEIDVKASNIPNVFCDGEEIPEVPGKHLQGKVTYNYETEEDQTAFHEIINKEIQFHIDDNCDPIELLIWNNIDGLHYFQIALLSMLELVFIPIENDEEFRIREDMKHLRGEEAGPSAKRRKISPKFEQLLDEIKTYIYNLETSSNTIESARMRTMIDDVYDLTLLLPTIDYAEAVDFNDFKVDQVITLDPDGNPIEGFRRTRYGENYNFDEVGDVGRTVPRLNAVYDSPRMASSFPQEWPIPSIEDLADPQSPWVEVMHTYRGLNGIPIAESSLVDALEQMNIDPDFPGPGHIPPDIARQFGIEGELFPAEAFVDIRLPKPALKFSSVNLQETIGIDLDFLPNDAREAIIYNFIHQNPQLRERFAFYYPDLPRLQPGQSIPNQYNLVYRFRIQNEEGVVENGRLLAMKYLDVPMKRYSDDYFDLFQTLSAKYDNAIAEGLKLRRTVVTKSFMEDSANHFFEQYIRKFKVDGGGTPFDEIRKEILKTDPELVRNFYKKYYENLGRFNFEDRYRSEIANTDIWTPTGQLKITYRNGIGADSFLDRFRNAMDNLDPGVPAAMMIPMHDYLNIDFANQTQLNLTDRISRGDFSRLVDTLNEGMQGMDQYIRGSFHIGNAGISRKSYSLNNYINQIYSGIFSGDFTAGGKDLLGEEAFQLENIIVTDEQQRELLAEIQSYFNNAIPTDTLDRKVANKNLNIFMELYCHLVNSRQPFFLNDPENLGVMPQNFSPDDFEELLLSDFFDSPFSKEQTAINLWVQLFGFENSIIEENDVIRSIRDDLTENLLPTNNWKDSFYAGKIADLNTTDLQQLTELINSTARTEKCIFAFDEIDGHTMIRYIPQGVDFDFNVPYSVMDMPVPDLSKIRYNSVSNFLNIKMGKKNIAYINMRNFRESFIRLNNNWSSAGPLERRQLLFGVQGYNLNIVPPFMDPTAVGNIEDWTDERYIQAFGRRRNTNIAENYVDIVEELIEREEPPIQHLFPETWNTDVPDLHFAQEWDLANNYDQATGRLLPNDEMGVFGRNTKERLEPMRVSIHRDVNKYKQYINMDYGTGMRPYVFINTDTVSTAMEGVRSVPDLGIPPDIYEMARNLMETEQKYMFISKQTYENFGRENWAALFNPDTDIETIENWKLDDINAFTFQGAINPNDPNGPRFKWRSNEPLIAPPSNFKNLTREYNFLPLWRVNQGSPELVLSNVFSRISRVIEPRDHMGRLAGEIGFNQQTANDCIGMYSFKSTDISDNFTSPDVRNSVLLTGDLRQFYRSYGEVYFGKLWVEEVKNKLNSFNEGDIMGDMDMMWRQIALEGVEIEGGPISGLQNLVLMYVGLRERQLGRELTVTEKIEICEAHFNEIFDSQIQSFNKKYLQKYAEPTDEQLEIAGGFYKNTNRIIWGQKVPPGIMDSPESIGVNEILGNLHLEEKELWFGRKIKTINNIDFEFNNSYVKFKTLYPYEIDQTEWLENGTRSKHIVETRIVSIFGDEVRWSTPQGGRTSVHLPGEWDRNLRGLFKTGESASFQTFDGDGMINKRVYNINSFGQHAPFNEINNFLWWYHNPVDGAVSLGFSGRTPMRNRIRDVNGNPVAGSFVWFPWQRNFKLSSSYGDVPSRLVDNLTNANKGKYDGIFKMSDFWNYLSSNRRNNNMLTPNQYWSNTQLSSLDESLNYFNNAQTIADPSRITVYENNFTPLGEIYRNGLTRPDQQNPLRGFDYYNRQTVTTTQIKWMSRKKESFRDQFTQFFGVINKRYTDHVFNVMSNQITINDTTPQGISILAKRNPYLIYDTANLANRVNNELRDSPNVSCQRIEPFIFSSAKSLKGPLCGLQGKYEPRGDIDEICGKPSNKRTKRNLDKIESFSKIVKSSSWFDSRETLSGFITAAETGSSLPVSRKLPQIIDEFFVEGIRNKWIRSKGYMVPSDLRIIKNLMWLDNSTRFLRPYIKTVDRMFKPPGYTIQAARKLVSQISLAGRSTRKLASFVKDGLFFMGMLAGPVIGLGIKLSGEILDAVLCYTNYSKEMRDIAYSSCVKSLSTRRKWTSEDCVKDFATTLGCPGVAMETTHGVSYKTAGNPCFNKQKNISSDHTTPYQLRTMFNHEIEKGTWDNLNAPLRFPEDIQKWLPSKDTEAERREDSSLSKYERSLKNTPSWAVMERSGTRGIFVPGSSRDEGRLVGLLDPQANTDRYEGDLPRNIIMENPDPNPEYPNLYYIGNGTWSLGVDVGDPTGGFFTETNPDHTDWLKEDNIAAEVCRQIPNYLKQTGVIDEDKLDISDFNYTSGMLDDSPFECTLIDYKNSGLPRMYEGRQRTDMFIPTPVAASCAKRIKCLKCDETSTFDSAEYVKEQIYITRGLNDYGEWTYDKNAVDFVSDLWQTEEISDLDIFAFLPVYTHNTEKPNEIWSSKQKIGRLAYGVESTDTSVAIDQNYSEVGSWLNTLEGSNLVENPNNGFLIPPNSVIQFTKEMSFLPIGRVIYNNTRRYLHVKVPEAETYAVRVWMNSDKFNSYGYLERRSALDEPGEFGKFERVRRLDCIDRDSTYKGEITGYPNFPSDRNNVVRFLQNLYQEYTDYGITYFQRRPTYHNDLARKINQRFDLSEKFNDIKTRPRPYAQYKNDPRLWSLNNVDESKFGYGTELITYPGVIRLEGDSMRQSNNTLGPRLPPNNKDIRFYIPPRTQLDQHNGPNDRRKTSRNESWTEWVTLNASDCKCVETIKWKYI